jgi:hypothetical protein
MQRPCEQYWAARLNSFRPIFEPPPFLGAVSIKSWQTLPVLGSDPKSSPRKASASLPRPIASTYLVHHAIWETESKTTDREDSTTTVGPKFAQQAFLGLQQRWVARTRIAGVGGRYAVHDNVIRPVLMQLSHHGFAITVID